MGKTNKDNHPHISVKGDRNIVAGGDIYITLSTGKVMDVLMLLILLFKFLLEKLNNELAEFKKNVSSMLAHDNEISAPRKKAYQVATVATFGENTFLKKA